MASTSAVYYREIAGEVFAPLYPYYASLIVEKTGVRSGRCLDAGCGGGHLGLELAGLTEMKITFLDQSPIALDVVRENLAKRGLSDRAELIEANVEAIPLPACSIDLVVSRGSIPFWKDLPAAFREIMRVLRPGGQVYIGGGLGTPEMRERIQRSMRQRDPEWQKGMGRIPQRSVTEYSQALVDAGIPDFIVEKGDEGTWIRFKKNEQVALCHS